ncbi:MAG TPA: hypothetical protein PLX71_10915, partial [Phycicoccus sp.]|nr:hypothetical protein [Phycicoccus sp.]
MVTAALSQPGPVAPKSAIAAVQPGRPLRDNVHADLARQAENPVPARLEQADELAVTEVQALLVRADL